MKPGGGATSVFTIDIKPIIAELARTEVCFPNIQLLVDKIIVQSHFNSESPRGAFRLWLTDGEKTIQALVKRRLYKRLVTGDIREGSYVLLKEYTVERADKTNGKGEIIYLALKNFYAIGEDDREKPDTPDYLTAVYETMGVERSKVERQSQDDTLGHVFPAETPIPTPKARRLVDERPISRSSAVTSEQDLGKLRAQEPIKSTGGHASPSCSPSSRDGAKKRKIEIALGEIDPNFGSPPKKAINYANIPTNRPTSAQPKKISSSQERIRGIHKTPPQRRTTSPVRFDSNKANAVASPSSKSLLPGRPDNPTRNALALPAASRTPSGRLAPIERPLNLIPLSRLKGYTRRNVIYDVFVVIYTVDRQVTKRSRLLPAQRDLRVVDPSTEKKVCLSVFVDPEKFKPTVGTIALIRSVTTHEWDGGSIKIWPQRCEGKQWFLPDPVGIPGCDVKRMRDWWRERQALEDEKAVSAEETKRNNVEKA